MISVQPLSTLSVSSLPTDISQGTAGPFQILLNNPDAQFVYLVELKPFSDDEVFTKQFPSPLGGAPLSTIDYEVTGGIATRYFSDQGFITEPADAPANTTYLPLALNPFQFDVSILSGDEFRGASPSFGAITILNGDSSLDSFSDLFWESREVDVFAGGNDFSRSEFEKIFNGLITSPEFDEEEIILNISDKRGILEKNFDQNLYAGTGGLEGGDDIANQPKPLVYGQIFNATPVLVDEANLIYQIHDGSMEAVDAVYDRGVELTDAGDVADITATSVSAGQYKTQLSGGYIKLGSTPDGLITCDAKGENAGGYIKHAGEIVEYLLKNKLGFNNFSAADVDSGAINNLDETITGTVGIFIDRETSLVTVLNDLLIPLHVYWTFKRDGEFTVGVIDSPSSPVFTITDDNIDDDGLEILNVIPPAFRITLGYKKAYSVQSEEDLAAGATTAQRTFAIREYRSVVSESTAAANKSVNKIEKNFNSLLATKADAQTEIARLLDIYSVQRKVIRVSAVNLLFRIFIGDVVNLETDRFGLSGGKEFLVVAISEDVETKITELELWG